jgi:hypothetical protein
MDNVCEVEQLMTGTREVGHKQFAMVPGATGAITRLAYARAKKAGITLPPLLSQSGLTLAQIENRHLRLKVKGQITFSGLSQMHYAITSLDFTLRGTSTFERSASSTMS